MTSPIALVTGGSGGIGLACARVLVTRGYDTVLTARHAETLEEHAAELGARWVAADCSIEADVAHLLEQTGTPKLVVHAAGILEGTFVRDQPVSTWDHVLETNLRSAYLVTRAVLQRMQAGGRIIYISSTAGLKGMKGLSAYSASKAAIAALAQSVAAEVERDGIGVHLVTPAPVRTGMIDPDTSLKMWLLEPDDVASTVAWLDSLHPRVVIREVVLRSVATGPFAPEPIGQVERPEEL